MALCTEIPRRESDSHIEQLIALSTLVSARQFPGQKRLAHLLPSCDTVDVKCNVFAKRPGYRPGGKGRNASPKGMSQHIACPSPSNSQSIRISASLRNRQAADAKNGKLYSHKCQYLDEAAAANKQIRYCGGGGGGNYSLRR